jgi:hypothetical protein
VKTIYKYHLALTDVQHITTLKGAIPLTVQMQRDQLCLWAKVDTDRPYVLRKFAVVGTGNRCEYDEYVGSVQIGIFVFHVFDLGEVLMEL